eukprot:2378512-Rhodomonas_salina.3
MPASKLAIEYVPVSTRSSYRRLKSRQKGSLCRVNRTIDRETRARKIFTRSVMSRSLSEVKGKSHAVGRRTVSLPPSSTAFRTCEFTFNPRRADSGGHSRPMMLQGRHSRGQGNFGMLSSVRAGAGGARTLQTRPGIIPVQMTSVKGQPGTLHPGEGTTPYSLST